MSKAAATLSDPTLARIRAVLSLDGTTGQAGEVVLNLTNQPDITRLFRSASASVEGAYTVTVETEETFFLSMRPDGALIVHVGPSTGATTARFSITRVDGFEYQVSPTETHYTFTEQRPTGQTKLHIHIRW